MDRSVTYVCDGASLVMRGYLAAKPGVCNVSTGAPFSAKSITRTFSEVESRTLTRGDHVHSFPFTGTYETMVPLSGRLTHNYRNTSASGPDKAVCGAEAGSTMRYSSDAGYHSTSPSATHVKDDPALQGFLKRAADTKANADLRRSYYSLGIIMAERAKSVSYVTDKALFIAKMVKKKQAGDVKRYISARLSDRKQVARDISGEHLAFIFGLLPLIGELEGIVTSLSSETALKVTGRGRMASEELSSTSSRIKSITVSSTALPVAIDTTTDTKTRYSHRTSVTCNVSVSGAQAMREHGLNPIATFYDIVPLSFLTDFVSNLGTFLRSYDPIVGLDFETGSSTLWRERVVTHTVTGATYVARNDTIYRGVTTVGSAQSVSRALRVERTPLKDFPESSLLLVNNMSLAKAATLGSLAIQRYLKPVRAILALRTFRYRGPRPRYLPPIKYRKA